MTVVIDRPRGRKELDGLIAACSAETLRQRFCGQVTGLPPAYAEEVLAGRPDRHDALVARIGRHVTGLASLAVDEVGTGELGVLVADPWQRRGIGRELCDALLDRARGRGLERVAVVVLPGRTGLVAALSRRLQLLGWSHAPEATTCVYKLS